MRSLFAVVLRHRLAVLVAIVVLTALSGVSLTRAVVSSSLGKLFLGNESGYRAYRERVREFGSDEMLIVAWRSDALLAASELRRLRRVVDRIDDLPHVDRVDSLLDAQHIWGTGEEDFVEMFLAEVEAHPERAGQVLDQLRSDPFTGGFLVGYDGKSTAIVVTLDRESEQAAERQVELVRDVTAVLESEGLDETRLHWAGSIAVVAEMIRLAKLNLWRLFPIVCLVLTLTVWLVFRRLWPVLVSMAVALVAVAWTMGIAILIDREISLLMAAVPAVILIIAFSDVIHLASAYLIELADSPSKEEAILRSAADVGKACVYTSLTTCIGFVCLSFVPTPVFQRLGLVLGVGVALALLLAVTLVPILLSYLPRPKPWIEGEGPKSRGWLDGLLAATRAVALGWPRTVIAGFAVLLAVSIVGITQIRVETDIVERFSPSNPVRRSAELFRSGYAGPNVFDFYVEFDEDRALEDPRRMAELAAFEDAVRATPGVDQAASIATIVRAFHWRATGIRAALAGGTAASGLPDDEAELRQYLVQLELFSGGRIDQLIDLSHRTARVIVRVRERGLRETNAVGRAALAHAERIFAPSVEVRGMGMSFLMGGWLDRILEGQQRGLGLSLTLITLVMVIALRSLRVGLWSMLPNVLPLLALGGWVGLFWDEVDSDTIMIAMLALGIGVDDTIHFLMRYRIESERSDDDAEALDHAYRFAGRGIVITTIILVLGFAPFATSDYFSLRILGTLLPLVLVVALAADLLLVPALGKVGWLRFRRRRADS